MTQEIRTIRIATQGPAGPTGSQVFCVASQAAMLALTAHQGDVAVRTDINTSFALATSDPTQLANWTELLAPGGGGSGAVSSVAGRTGDVTLSAGDISGLAASATTDTTNAGNIGSGTLNTARLAGVTLTANNLSDLANAGTARSNLGLGALATLGVGSGLSSNGTTLSATGGGGAVTSVAGRTGDVTLAAGDISGLASVATSGAYADVTGTPAAALPLAGGTMTGKVTIALGAANVSSIVTSGGSNTGSNAASALDHSWTLNTTGSPDVFALRVTDTARGSGTKLFNIYAGAAGASSVFSVDRNGLISCGGIVSGNLGFAAVSTLSWSGRGILTSPVAGTVQFGAADAASPVNQIVVSQGSRAGTDSNVAGGDLTVQAGAGTGTAAPAALNFRSPVAVASGTTAQTQTLTLKLQGGNVIMPNLPASDPHIVGALWNNSGVLTVSAG